MNPLQMVTTGMFQCVSLVTALYLCGQFAWLARYGYPQPRQESLGRRLLIPLNFGIIAAGMITGTFLVEHQVVALPWVISMMSFALHIMFGNWVLEDLGSEEYRSNFEGGVWMADVNQRSAHQKARFMTALWLITGLVAVIVLISLK